jgi:AcrR family transcriptional regulator
MKLSGSTPQRKTGRPLSFDRDAVLEKAMLTFWQYGYETTSVSDLTRATGVNAPSLYAAFGDKKRLFLEAVRLYAGDMTGAARELDNARSSYDAARSMLVGAATAFTSATKPKGCLLASATASGSAASADVQNAVADIRREIEGHLREQIERDISSDVLPPETHASALSGMVMAVIQGMSVLARDGATRAHLLAITESAMCAFPKRKRSAHKRDTH